MFEGDELKKLWNEFLIGNPSVTWSRLWPLIVLENWMEKHGIEA
ncbi:MAG: asparagine synthase (glutamine-hydrolyzing) [Flammeovirgaceae bacterium]